MFTIGWRPRTPGAFSATLARPAKAIASFVKKVPGLVFWSHEAHVQHIFAVEGDPPWASLAVSTIIHRLHAGFPPERPILERTGSFKNAMAFASTEVRPLGKEGIQVRIGVADPRFIWHQLGTRYMPARPVVPATESQQRERCQEVEEVLVAALEDILWETHG